jgi:hypothetical protein
VANGELDLVPTANDFPQLSPMSNEIAESIRSVESSDQFCGLLPFA